MLVFGDSLRNLTAAIGVAFIPIVQQLSGTMNRLNALITPLMQRLAPIMGQLANFLEGRLIQVVGFVTDTLQALAPVLQFAADVLTTFSDALTVITATSRAAFSSLLESISALFGGINLKDIAAGLRDAVQTATKALVALAAYISKFVGDGTFLSNLIQNLQDREKNAPGTVAAPTNQGVTGFENIAKELTAAAFAATGAATDNRTTEQFLSEIRNMLEGIQRDQRSLDDVIYSGVEKWWTEQGLPYVQQIPAAIGAAVRASIPGANLFGG
jgi:phage-related protein